MKELDRHHDKKEQLLKQLGDTLYSTARSRPAFNGGRPIETSAYKMVAGPRTGTLSLSAGLHGKRLYSALMVSEKANLRALFSAVKKWKLEGDPITYWRGERLVIEAPWQKGMQLSNVSLADIPVRANDGYTALLGLRQDYTFHVIRFDQQLNPHELLVGVTGSGKTVTMITIIVQLARAEDARFIIIDGKGGPGSLGEKIESLHGLIGPVAYSHDDALAAINWALNELQLRKSEEHAVDDPIHIFIDEFQEFMTNSEFSNGCGKIGSLGRSLNMHLHLGTQRPSKNMWGIAGGDLKAQFTRKIIHRLESHHDVMTVTGTGTPPAYALCGSGDVYELNASGVERVQVAMATDDDIKRVTGFTPLMSHWPNTEEAADAVGQRFGSLQIYASVYNAALHERNKRTGGRGTLQKMLKALGCPEPSSGIADDLLQVGRDIVTRIKDVTKKE